MPARRRRSAFWRKDRTPRGQLSRGMFADGERNRSCFTLRLLPLVCLRRHRELSANIGQPLNRAPVVRAPIRVEMRTPMSLALRAKLLRDAPPVVDERAKTASVNATAVIASPSRHRRVGTKCNGPSVKPLDSVGFYVAGNGSAPRLRLQSNLPESVSLAVA
jgi:hypothetical protein